MVSLPTRGTSLRFDGFFRHQPNGPTGAAFRRAAADHGNQLLFLGNVQQGYGSGPLFFVKCPFQAASLVPMAEFSNGLWSQRNNAGNSRGTHPFGELQQCQRAEHDSDLLHATANQLFQFFLVLGGHLNAQSRASHTPSMGQNNSA